MGSMAIQKGRVYARACLISVVRWGIRSLVYLFAALSGGGESRSDMDMDYFWCCRITVVTVT